MKSLKKTLVLLVVLSMILSAVSPVFAFSDVIAEEYAEQANKMAAFGVFTGDANGNFNAEENITRAEMAVVIGRLMGLTTNEANANQGYASNFSDVNAGEWYTGWVNLVAGRGIISGFPDGTFRPNEKVTQAQAVTMIVKALGWGVVVDQTGTWPANYITKASELRLFKDAVDTNSELVTRGNVAIYCYNALTAKTWDVTESTNGELTSSKTSDTILEKYFSDFVNEDGDMKLVEGATVVATPATDGSLGANQIVVDATKAEFETSNEKVDTLVEFLETKSNVKNKEEKTYTYSDDDTDMSVVAYVVEDACANILALGNKKVDIIFGKNNEVAYIAVTEDTVDSAYITAWDLDEAELEIDGEAYDVNYDAVVTLHGYRLTNGRQDAVEAIDDAISTMKVANPDKVFNRTIAANVVLDEDGAIDKIDLMCSQHFGGEVPVNVKYEVDSTTGEVTTKVLSATYIGMEEGIVKSISSKGVIKGYNNAKILDSRKIEDVEDEDEPRVIKNGEIVTLEDIKEGDVVTALYEKVGSNKEYKLVYVSSEKVTGTIAKVKNNAITVDDEVYNTVRGILVNNTGDIDEANAKNPYGKEDDINWKDLYDEDVELYLNYLGEVSAIVAETEATDLTVGLVTKTPADREDQDAGVWYVSIKLLTKDGTTKTYKVYNEDDDEDLDVDDLGLEKGNVVVFSADADGKIESDEIKKLTGDVKDLDGKDLTYVEVAEYSKYDDEKILDADGNGYRFRSSTVSFNYGVDVKDTDGKVTTDYEDLGIIDNAWNSLVAESHDAAGEIANVETAFALVDTEVDRVIYYFAKVLSYASETNNYGLLVDVELTTDEDEEKIYVAKLFVDGEYVTYELDASAFDATLATISSIKDKDGKALASEGAFVKYSVSDDEITAIETVAQVSTIADLADEASIKGLINGVADRAVKDSIEVRTIEEDDIFFADDAVDADGKDVKELPEITVDEDGCIIYDFRDGEVEMFDGEVEDLEGLLVYGFAADCNEGYVDILVIFE